MSIATSTIELQACPGCGAAAEVKKNGSRWKVLCEKNKSTLSSCQKMGHTMPTRKEAVRVWNEVKETDVTSQNLPVRLTQAVVVTDAAAMQSAPVHERNAAMTDLFLGLTRAVQSGARVDLNEPLRIVVTKSIF